MLTKIFGAPFDWLESFGINPGWLMLPIGLFLAYIAFSTIGIEVGSNRVIGFMVATAPIWLPLITFLLFFNAWMEYVQLKFDLNQGRITLEIKLPEEIMKSPEAMELVLIQLHQTAAPDNLFQTYIDGKHPPVHSLEIVSRGGDLHFYVNVPTKKFKNIAEAQLYAQYPGIEIKELPVDYTAEIPWDPDRFDYFSIHFGPKKADAYPIKTYYEYGLHTMPKEEEKVDPITSMLDALGSIGPGEYMWAQIMIDANREVTFGEGSLKKQPDWKKAAREEIQKIMDDAKKRAGEDAGGGVMMQLTDGEKETIRSIERSLSKNAFNTAIRSMYIATKDKYLPGERIGAMITGWRGYDDISRNAIGVRWRTDFDWNMWQDPTGKRRQEMKKKELLHYKLRAYLPYAGFKDGAQADGKKVMTTEELATIFHLPGRVATTPTLGRIGSARSEAPPNLPVAPQ